MLALWWLIGQSANLLQCATFAYYCIVFLVGLPIFLPQIITFLTAARSGWAAWFADAQRWFTRLFSAAHTDCTAWSADAHQWFSRPFSVVRANWVAWLTATQRAPTEVLPGNYPLRFAGCRQLFGGGHFNGLRSIGQASVEGINYCFEKICGIGR